MIDEFHEYDDPNGEWNRRYERDLEREPRAPLRLTPRRRQFRYWSGAMFRPVQQDIAPSELARRAA